MSVVLLTPLAVALSPPSAPLTPTASTGTSVGEIDLTWTAPAVSGASAVAGYRIYRMVSPVGLVHLVDIGNILAFTDATVPDGAPRYYRISAVNGDGEGPLSDTVTAQAKSAPTRPIPFNAFAGPNRFNITLTWGAPQYNGSADVTSYKVYRASTWTGPFSLQATVATLNHTNFVGADNATFAYYATAVNAYGEGIATPIINGTSARTPGMPLNVTAIRVIGSGNYVEWDRPADTGGLGIDKWRVDRSVNGGPFAPRALMTGFFMSYRDGGCPMLSVCAYRVAALNELGYGPVSAAASTEGDALPVINRCALCSSGS